jgi:cytochrome P450
MIFISDAASTFDFPELEDFYLLTGRSRILSYYSFNMEKTTAFQSSMQFPRLSAALSVIFLLVLWRLQAWAVIYRRRSRIKREHGCQDPAKFPNKDPIFGLDVWLDTYQSMKHHRLLPKIASRYKTAGANTFRILIAGKYRISTIEPENIKAMLSTKFTSFVFPARRTYVLKQFMGDAIFVSHGPTWQHSRATIRPHLTKDSFIDSEMSRFEKHFGRMLKAIPRDRSTVDLQPLFFLFTMNAAIEMLTGKDLQSEEQLALAKEGNYGNIVELFDDAQRMLAFRAVLPYGSLPANEKQHIKRCQEWVDRCVIQAIIEHKSGKVAGDGEKLSFLQELVKETDDHVWIRGELIAVLIAGRDTTASTLSSLWFVLAKRPDIVAKLQAEVAELNGERPGFTRLKQMEYVQHTIQECKTSLSFFHIQQCI